MKKILTLMLMIELMLSMVASTSFAMTFSQPIKIESVSDYGIVGGGYKFEGTVSNNGTLYLDKNEKYYKNGVASFGINNNLIYLHYNDKNYNNKQSIRCYGGKI